MKYDEFAFFNQQLASMLKDGIPLEGALKQLSAGMRAGRLRREFEALESDLAHGVPLARALAARDLPDVYVRMLEVGVKSNNLPGVLTLLADYYHRVNATWTRLKGVLVYPAIVLALSLCISIFLVFILRLFDTELLGDMMGEWRMEAFRYRMLLPPIFIGAVAAAVAVALSDARLRRYLSWRVPPFRWAKLAQTASAMTLMLRGGCTLSEAVALLRQIERGTPAEREFARWEEQLTCGHSAITFEGTRLFPPLFVWLVENSGEDPAGGFEQAAKMYEERAAHGTDMLLYGALPVSVFVLGSVVLMQAGAVVSALVDLMNMMTLMSG